MKFKSFLLLYNTTKNLIFTIFEVLYNIKYFTTEKLK